MVAIGMDGMAYLEAPQWRAILMSTVFEQAVETRRTMDHNLAIEIANNVGKLFGG